MANICCDDVYFFSDDNTEGIEALWKDLQASITPGYKDDLGQIERLFLHAGLSTEGINLRGTVVAMERTDHAVQLSLDTAWRPLHDAYTALTAAYGIQFVMESIEPGCGIFFNTDDDGIAFSDRYCVTGDTSVVTPSGLVLWEKLEYGDTFSSENVLLQHFRDLGYKTDTLETLTKTLDEQEVYIHSFINPYQ